MRCLRVFTSRTSIPCHTAFIICFTHQNFVLIFWLDGEESNKSSWGRDVHKPFA